MNFTGIRHVHLLVAEHERAVAFYTTAFGMTEVFRIGPLALAATPGGGDSLALHLATTEEERARIGQQGGGRALRLPPADGTEPSPLRVHGAVTGQGSVELEGELVCEFAAAGDPQLGEDRFEV